MDISEWLNKIYCGNAFDLLPKMPEESIDVVMFSPPYSYVK